jgi:glycerol-3-phosphate acyltransferase PlsX
LFLGLNGIGIKSHGGTDAEGFAAAVDIGYDLTRHDLLARIGEALRRDGGDALPRLLGGSRS